MVNEFRFGWFKDRQADDFNPDLQAGYPIGNVSLSVAGVSTLGGYNILPRILPSENRYQFADSLSWVKGAHTFKFGFDITRTEDFSNSLSNRFGSYTYSSVTTFAQDFTSPDARPQPLLQLRPGLRQSDHRHQHHRPGILRPGHLEDHAEADRELRPAL